MLRLEDLEPATRRVLLERGVDLRAVPPKQRTNTPRPNPKAVRPGLSGTPANGHSRSAFTEQPKMTPRSEPTEVAERGSRPDLLLYLHNDHGNAKRLIALHESDVRYCHAFKKWLTWDGLRWAIDTTDRVRGLAVEAMMEFFQQAVAKHNDAGRKFACLSLDARRIGNLLSLAECEVAIPPDKLDVAPHLLNFLNGTVDLRTGELRTHARKDFLTKVLHHRYLPGAQCPRFLQFLHRIMGDGPDASEPQRARSDRLVSYLQRALGYSLTGLTTEKAVFLAHGSGNNGKTTLLSTFLHLLEEYAVLLQIDTLMVRQESNNTQADLADLRGARFVMTSETEEGQRLAEGKLKRITQGMGRIKAVRKYENPIEFPETHKLWLDCNHRPIVRGSDNAIWNRLHLVPFEVTIPPEEIDRELPQKLLAEAEGILAWAVQGAVLWFKADLSKPAEVETAAGRWRADMDQIGRFIEDCCICDAVAQARARQLYSVYRNWAEEGGEHAVTENHFSQKLQERRCQRKHTKTGNVYIGIGLRAEGRGEG